MQVTAALVKELRERSGVGMMECKKALVETDGDLEAAFEHLRKSGAAKAAKKAGRIAAEGAIVLSESGPRAVMVEINSETDFVSKDDNFKRFAEAVAEVALEKTPSDVDALLALELPGGDTVETARDQLVAKIGEKISVRRLAAVDGADQTVATYLHGGRIGVIVQTAGGTPETARDVAMHIAATNPMCIGPDDVPAELLAKEREIQHAQARDSGKPPEIVEKMVEGRMRKYVAEISLTGQPFVKDPDTTVGKMLSAAGSKVVDFIRFEVGEGIEKKEENFADEVLAQARGKA